MKRSAPCLAVNVIEAVRRERAGKRMAIRMAIAEADRGGFISQESMDAWVASWGKESELPPPEPDVDDASR